MEEFRSTEIIDKEIYDDARRNAERLLKSAESDCQKILDDVNSRIQKASEEKHALYSGRIESLKKDLDASLPLEKKRFLVSFEDESINNSINNYIENLSKEKKLELLDNLLKKYAPELKSNKIHVKFHGFSKSEITKLIEKHLGSSSIDSLELLSDTAAESQCVNLGMIIESADKSLRCRATIDELVLELVDTHRFELAEALFGGRTIQ